MKKYLVIIPSLLLLLLQACGKGETDDIRYRTVGLTDKIEISDIAGDHPVISTISFVARFYAPPGAGGTGSTLDDSGKDTRVMLTVPFDNKGMVFSLPDNPPPQLLRSIASDIPAGFEISDTQANTISFVEIACNMTESRVRSFLYMTRSSEDVRHELQYIYCDREVTITGRGKDWWGSSTTYDLSLQKGWNMVIEKTVYAYDQSDWRSKTITNLMPNGMEWSYSIWL